MQYRESASPNTTTLFDEDTTTILRVKEGATGASGTQTANVQIYQRTSTNSAPAKPSGNTTFTFSTGALTGASLGNWTKTVPTGTAQYLWTCSATASATAGTTTDTIATGDWSTVVLQSEAQVARVATKRIYYDSWTFGSAIPTITNTQRDAITYNFDTGACASLPTGWSTSIGTVPYAYVDITFSESTYEGSYTRSLGAIRIVGVFDRIDVDDFDVNFDSSNDFQLRFGNAGLGTSTYQTTTTPGGLKNATIDIDASGNLTGTGATGVRVSNEFIAEADLVGGTKTFSVKPNKAEFDNVSSTEGVFGFKLDGASSFTDVDVFSSGERTKLDRLRLGKLPSDATKTLEDTAGSQTKASAAETAAKLQESTNRVTFPSNTTEGQFSFNIGSTSFTNDVFSSGERTKLNRLRLGQLPSDATKTLENTTDSQSKATAAETAAKTQESNNRFTVTTADTAADDGIFKFQIGGGTVTSYDVLSTTSQTNFNRLRQGQDPTDATKSIRNTGITLTSAGVLGGAGGGTLDLDDVNDTGTTKTGAARANAGLNSDGDVDRAVPTAKGGTGETNTNKFLNSDLGITLTGTTVTLTKAGDTNSTDTVPVALKNSNITVDVATGKLQNIGTADVVVNNQKVTVDSDGTLQGIGTSSIKVNNAKTTYSELNGTKPPEDANKVDISAGTDGRLSVAVNGATADNVEVFSTTDRQKLTNLRAGRVPGDGTGATTTNLENTTDSQAKVNARLSATEKTRLNAGNSPDNTKSFDNAGTITGNVTGKVNNVAVATISSGAQAGATANQDSTATILAGNLTGGITDGSTTFSAAEAINVRGAFTGIGSTPVLKVANANSALKNAQITTNLDGTLNYDGTAAVTPTVDGITGVTDFQSRVTTGLTSAGAVDVAVPTGKGGTGETNTNRFLNSGISISAGSSGVMTLNRGGYAADTTTITKSNLGLSYDDGATVGAVLGTNLKASNGTTTLGDNDVKNDSLSLDYSGTSILISKDDGLGGTTQIGDTVAAPTALKNSNITVNSTTGKLENIGTADVVVNNQKVTVDSDGDLVGIGTSNIRVNNSKITTKADGTLNYDGTPATTPDIDSISDAGTTKTNAARAGTGLDASGRLKTSIISGTDVVSVADLKTTKTRTFSAIDSSNRLIGNIFDGTTAFTPTELLKVRASFNNIGTTPTLKAANADTSLRNSNISSSNVTGALGFTPGTSNFSGDASELTGTLDNDRLGIIPVSKGGTALTSLSTLLNSNITSSNITTAGGVVATALTFGAISYSSGGTCSFFSTNNGSSYTATNATGELSITHPTLGTFACNYAWTRTGSNISAFALTNTGTGNDEFTSSTFGSASVSKLITVTHTESNKTIVVSASVTTFNLGSGGSGGGGGGCFISGTKVELPGKEQKQIQEIEIGEYVLTEKKELAKVLNKGSIKVDSYYYINQELGLTAGHPIWVEDKGWACIDPGEYYKECKLLNHVIDLEPAQLEIGDKTTNGTVDIINKVEEEQEVWWITVDNTHTYYVNKILVHNGSKP